MRFIIVKNGSLIIGKEAYAGDDEKIDSLIEQKVAENPDLSYEATDESSFDSFSIEKESSREDPSWKDAKTKGVDSAISFLAKKLGLE